jgi:N-acylneuraminate cytidylyltransferase
MTAFAFIPARGGSKGIPGKNLQAVGGHPLVVRTIRAARAAARIDRVFVSTDDPEIAAAARTAGAEVIDRPAEISGDTASSESAVLHALAHLEQAGDALPDVTVMLQCTSPFSTATDIDGTLHTLHAESADCAFTGHRTYGFLWRRGPDGAEAVNHDATTRPRRQDRPADYLETGAVYAMRTAGFRSARHRFFGKIAIHEVPAAHALEIDEPEDLAAARALAPLHPGDAAAVIPTNVALLVLDFDGVITDNRVVTFEDGREAVLSDRGDGFGIERLRAAGVPVLVLSKERNPVVSARAEKLRVEVLQGVDDKAPALRAWLDAHAISPAEVVYVGNDVNDLECMALAGCGVAVADAHPEVRRAADLVLAECGGRGAVRAIAELVRAATMGSL